MLKGGAFFVIAHEINMKTKEEMATKILNWISRTNE